MAQDVLDLDRDVVGEAGELAGDAQPVGARGSAVQEIGIAKRDVLRAGADLRAHVVQDDIEWNRPESAAINRHDRTVPAQMLAASRGLGGSDDASTSIRHLQRGVTRSGGCRAIGLDEAKSRLELRLAVPRVAGLEVGR